MDSSTPPPGRPRGDSRPGEIAALRESVRGLHEELHALRRDFAGLADLVSTANAFTKLEDSITALNYTLAGSMEQVVDGMGPLRRLDALVPERSWKPLEPEQAVLLEGLQAALDRPDFGSKEGLSKIPESPRRGIFEQGMETAG